VCGRNEIDLEKINKERLAKIDATLSIIDNKIKQIEFETEKKTLPKNDAHLGAELGKLKKEKKLLTQKKEDFKTVKFEDLEISDALTNLDTTIDTDEIMLKYLNEKTTGNNKVKVCEHCRLIIAQIVENEIEERLDEEEEFEDE
jgi:hypothetical protein